MFKFHYLVKVPSCPFCHSNRTGRYINKNVSEENIQYVEDEYLKRGEYVRIRRPWQTEYSAFCLDCDNSWYTPLYGQWVSRAEKRAYIEEKIDPDDVENAKNTQYKTASPKQKSRFLRQAGSLAVKGTKKMLRLMVYDPTIGTVKDLLKIKPVSDHNQKEEPNFENLYEEIIQEELENEEEMESYKGFDDLGE